MRSPEIEPARLERLLAGFAPETAQEAILQGLVRELRGGMPEAPLVLRERVRMICEPVSRRPVVTRRRLVAVALVGALVAAVGAFALVGRGSGEDTAATPSREVSATQTVAGAASEVPLDDVHAQSGDEGKATGFESIETDAARAAAPSPSTIFETAPSTRAQDVKMSLAIRVADAEALSDATNDALALTKRLGGHVVASAVDTDGTKGEAQLALSIPVGKIEDAVVGLSALGTITHQNVRTVDLQGDLDQRAKRIERLQRSIAADSLRLESGTLSAEQKLIVELRLARTRADLLVVRRERAAIARQAANAELTLTLRTGSAAAAKDEDEGTIAGAARTGVDFLAAAGAVAVLVLIAASPLIVLAFLAWFLLRIRRRRIDERLLAEPRPAGPPRSAE